jgi:hypothetical protein
MLSMMASVPFLNTGFSKMPGGPLAMMNFACSIVDDIKNLPFIQKAMINPDFIKLMSFSNGLSGQRYDKKAISTFRKDWWKEYQC